jgi:hypothetical protein
MPLSNHNSTIKLWATPGAIATFRILRQFTIWLLGET